MQAQPVTKAPPWGAHRDRLWVLHYGSRRRIDNNVGNVSLLYRTLSFGATLSNAYLQEPFINTTLSSFI